MKLHPLSVPYRAIAGSLNLGTLVFLATVVGSGVDPQSMRFLATLGLYAVAMLFYQALYYRRFEYALSGDTLDITSGVFSRRQREIPLGRVQNVDVSQNPLQRALGIAGVRIETAGGGDAEATLRYVEADSARRLRSDLRRETRTREDETLEAPDAGDDELVFALSTRNLVVLSLFTIDAGAGMVSTLFGAIASGGDPENLAGLGWVVEELPGGRLEAIALGVLAVAVLAWLLSVVVTFGRYYGFELRRTRDGLEYERGFLQQYSGTIPVEKVQTVSLRENLFHRRLGYASLAVETAGYSPGGATQERTAAVPLAGRDRTLEIARSLEPFEDDDLERPPTRARRRYLFRYAGGTLAVAGVVAAVGWWAGLLAGLAPYYWLALVVPVALVPVSAHYTWVHRGYRAGTGHFLARNGFWMRVTRVVPYYRVQTVVDQRSVFQRRRDLGSVTADTASSASLVGGDATAIDVDAESADRLHELLGDRLQDSLRAHRSRRARERSERASTTVEQEPSGGPVDGSDSGDPTATDDPGTDPADADSSGDDSGTDPADAEDSTEGS